MVWCTVDLSSYILQWYGRLLESAYHLYWQSRMAHCCFLVERNHFLYDSLLADVAMPLSPAIGPKLGASFVAAGFRPPLRRVGCHALGLQQFTETNTLI